MKRKVKVSVVVPNYNYLRFLPKRLESISNQTFADYEIILLDDCSNDGSQQYLRDYEASNPKVTACAINEKNTGIPFLQWDKGIRLAHGEYVWIAESDDYCTGDFLTHCVAALDACPTASFVVTGSHSVDENDVIIDNENYDYDFWGDNTEGDTVMYNGKEYVRHCFIWNNAAYNASGIVFRKNVYERIDKTFLSYRYVGDWLCWSEMALQGDVIEIHKKLNRFRHHPQRVTTRSACSLSLVEERAKLENFLVGTLVSPYWKIWAKGTYYKEVKRGKGMQVDTDEALNIVKEVTGITYRHYVCERILKASHETLKIVSTPLQYKKRYLRKCYKKVEI